MTVAISRFEQGLRVRPRAGSQGDKLEHLTFMIARLYGYDMRTRMCASFFHPPAHVMFSQTGRPLSDLEPY